MKIVFVFAAIIGLTLAAPHPRSLKDDLDEILGLLPLQDIEDISLDHAKNDDAFISVVLYLRGDDWAGIVDAVASNPKWLSLKQWLTDAGLPIQDIIDGLHDAIANVELGEGGDGSASLRPLLDEVEAIIPADDILAMVNDKLQNSPDFQDFYVKLSSQETHDLVDEVGAIEEVQVVADKLRGLGVKVDEALAFIYAFLGWDELKSGAINPKSLEDDLLEIVALIPLDDIDAIAKEHALNDDAFISVVLYLRGDEWAGIVEAVASNPKWQSLKDWLIEAGLPVQAIIDGIHDLIANAEVGEGGDGSASLRPFLDEVEAIIPSGDILALVNDKLQNSPDFQDFYVKLSSEETHDLVNEVRDLEEVQVIADKLRGLGVKVDEALAFIYAFLGWDELKSGAINPKSLEDDLLEIVALIPLDDIDAIAKEHALNDDAFISVVLYLRGDEWAGIVEAVASNPKWQSLKDWLIEAGLPVQAIIDGIHDLIANAEVGEGGDGSASLRPFLDEVEAIIPSGDILALVNDKLQNSPDFQDFYVKLSSQETHDLVDDVRALDEVQVIADKLRDLGVKVDEALAFIYAFLGWDELKSGAINPKSLEDDLLEIVALIPLDDIDAIAKEHALNDDAFISVVLYLRGDEWAGIVEAVASNPKWQSLKDWLIEAGLPVQAIIDGIHDLIANAEVGEGGDGSASLRPFLDEVEAIIPSGDILALVNDKLQNSPDFQDFYVKLSSQETHDLVDDVRALDEVQVIADKLRDLGVKVDEALAFIYAFLGWDEHKTQ